MTEPSYLLNVEQQHLLLQQIVFPSVIMLTSSRDIMNY